MPSEMDRGPGLICLNGLGENTGCKSVVRPSSAQLISGNACNNGTHSLALCLINYSTCVYRPWPVPVRHLHMQHHR